MDVTHIGLHLFFGIYRAIPINLGVFMFKYMFPYNEDSNKWLAYGRILTRLFSQNGVSFDVIVGTRPSEDDRIDKEYFKRLQVYYRGRWLYRRSKMKSSHAPGY